MLTVAGFIRVGVLANCATAARTSRGLALLALAYIAFWPVEYSVAQDQPRARELSRSGPVRVFRKRESPVLFPKKAKFVSKKPTLTKMAPFGLMATIWICMGLCSFAEIGSALQRGLAGHVASART